MMNMYYLKHVLKKLSEVSRIDYIRATRHKLLKKMHKICFGRYLTA